MVREFSIPTYFCVVTRPFVQLRKYFCNLQNHSCSCGNAFAICRTSRAAAEILLQFAEPLVQLQKYFCNLQNLSCSCGNAFVKSQNHSCSCGNTFVSTQNLLCKNKFIFCSCGFVIRRKAKSLLAIGKHELKYSRQQDFIFHKSIF